MGIKLTTLNYRLNSKTFPTYKYIGEKNKKNVQSRICIDSVEYSGIDEAEDKLGVNKGTILKRINSSKYSNYYYVEETKNNKKRKVQVKDKEFKSIKETSIYFDCSTSKVAKRCNSKNFPDWKFID